LRPAALEDGPELSQCDSERLRQFADVYQCRIAFAALDPTEVRPMQAGPLGQLLLGDSQAVSKLPHAPAESGPKVVHGCES
jgi:hypothetical protein